MTTEIVDRKSLMQRLGRSSETIRRWLKEGRLPQPDVAISRRTMGWRIETLRAARILIG
jgi:predicted DNA-binding transcriptional regulator AlpA